VNRACLVHTSGRRATRCSAKRIRRRTLRVPRNPDDLSFDASTLGGPGEDSSGERQERRVERKEDRQGAHEDQHAPESETEVLLGNVFS